MTDYFLLGLSLSSWYTILVILTLFTVLLKTKIDTAFVFMGAVFALFLGGVVDIKEAFGGFSSTSVMTVAVLYVVVAGLSYTGVLQWISHNMLGSPKSYTQAVLRLMFPAAFFSSILSNVAVVALFVKVVKTWSKKMNILPSKLLIPLSYASCMGGVCTLIGTPPNLIISGMYAEATGKHLSIFTTTLPGLFCLIVGVITIILCRKLLPDRKSPSSQLENLDQFTVRMQVPTDSKYVGMTISEIGLDKIKGGRLIEIIRFDREVISPISEDEFILGGDHLVFTGRIDDLFDVKKKYQFVVSQNHVFKTKEVERNRQMQIAFVTFNSKFIGKTLSEYEFEKKYNVVLIAIARQGARLEEDPRYIKVKAGDTILFEGKNLNQDSFEGNIKFIDSEDLPNIGKKTIYSSIIMIGMVMLSAFNVMPLLSSAIIAAIAMKTTKCCTSAQAKKSINWDILMIFAASICLGNAIEKTGLAGEIANGLMGVCGTNPYIILTILCLIATFATELISNTACGAIFYPIAYNAATALNCNPLTFMVALMVSVSSSFATPIGSPTHMLVYSEGGYKFSDFMRLGLLMNVVILIANIFITTIIFPL